MHGREHLAAAVLFSLLTAFASPALAQTSGYVGGIVFADVQRGSGQTSSSNGSVGAPKVDGTAIGGGVRGGVFLAAPLTLELGFDLGGPIDHSATPQISPLQMPAVTLPGPTVPGYVVPQFEEQVRTRTAVTSVLLGYHPPAHGRLRTGFAGGLSFVRTSMTVTDTIRYVALGNFVIPPPLVAPITTSVDTVTHQIAATVGAELAVELSRRAFVVPEIRAHGFDNRFVLRPGVAFRWQW